MFFLKVFALVMLAYTVNAVPVIMNVLQRTPEEAARIDTSDPFLLSSKLGSLPKSDGIQIPGRIQLALAQQKPITTTVEKGEPLDEQIFERVKYALIKGNFGDISSTKIIFDKPVVTVRAIEVQVPSEEEYARLIQSASGSSNTVSKPPNKYLPVDDGYAYPKPK